MIRFLNIFIFIFCVFYSSAQNDSILQVNLTYVNVICNKGAADVAVSGGKSPYIINWSTGQSNVTSVKELDEGDYSVTIKTSDSIPQDTVINFKIVKQDCPVIINNHFTPNGDSFNDTWQIGNIQNYPEFELFVYNKWGQQVHRQKNNYTPWDGTWQGIAVPDGTYYYMFYFKASDKDNFLKGDVSILR